MDETTVSRVTAAGEIEKARTDIHPDIGGVVLANEGGEHTLPCAEIEDVLTGL